MRRLMLRRAAAALSLAALAGGLSACGDAGKPITRASSEASYLDLSGLKYQVQISRQLNPTDPEDKDYFSGLPAGATALPVGTVWFGVFMRVENEEKDPIPSSRDFTIKDTQGKLFKPVSLPNAFAYRPEVVPGGGVSPNGERLLSYAGSQGELLLYKIPVASLDNRPLALTIRSPQDPAQSAEVELDV
jgi:hypothetical protein